MMGIRGYFMLITGVAFLTGSGFALMMLTALGVPVGWSALVVMLTSAAGGVVVSGIAFILIQPTLRRLYEMEEAAQLIGSGRLHQRVQVTSSKGEVYRLMDQFNRMAQRIEEQVSWLRRLVDENERLRREAEHGAALEERQRLSRELHDSVSQQLFALTMLSAAAERQWTEKSDALGRTLEQVHELSNAAQREMRALLLHLRPVELEGREFREASQAFLDAVTERHGLATIFECSLEAGIEPGVEEQLFRILQEAVANVIKHAEAKHVRVYLGEDGSMLTMRVQDDGIGFEKQSTEGQDTYGLTAMRERAVALGGTLEVWSRDTGTQVLVRIPKLGQGGGAGDD